MLRQGTSIIWLALAAVILLLLGGIVLIVDEVERVDRTSAATSAKHELDLLASMVSSDLQLGHYHHADEILREWGAGNPDVVALRLQAGNKFQVSEYQRPTPAEEMLTLEAPIVYSYSGSATLTLAKDLKYVAEHGNEMLRNLSPHWSLYPSY